jgi:twitching motility protein PilJ
LKRQGQVVLVAGFAVIAGEVKRLSDRSMRATKEVNASISTVFSSIDSVSKQVEFGLHGTENAVTEVRASEKNILNMVTLGKNVQMAMQSILEQTKVTAKLADNIGVATRQEKTAGNQMFQTMLEIKAVTAQTLSSVQHSEEVTIKLSSLAFDLKQSAGNFKLAND